MPRCSSTKRTVRGSGALLGSPGFRCRRCTQADKGAVQLFLSLYRASQTSPQRSVAAFLSHNLIFSLVSPPMLLFIPLCATIRRSVFLLLTDVLWQISTILFFGCWEECCCRHLCAGVCVHICVVVFISLKYSTHATQCIHRRGK